MYSHNGNIRLKYKRITILSDASNAGRPDLETFKIDSEAMLDEASYYSKLT
jgi:hypothetical protein